MPTPTPFTSVTCGIVTYTSATGSFGLTPYESNTNCVWFINAPLLYGQLVEISFSAFETESGYDYLYVYDGPSPNSAIILTATGSGLPSPVYCSSLSCAVRFVSDNSQTSSGWVLDYRIVEGISTPSSAPTPFATNCPITTGTYTDSTGNFGVIGYDDRWDCVWFINTMLLPGQFVEIYFSVLDTEMGYDRVFVYDGPSPNSPLLVTGEGRPDPLPAPVYCSASSCAVYFHTDGSIDRTGWWINYRVVTGIPSPWIPERTSAVGIIVGAVIGGVAFIIILVIICVCCCTALARKQARAAGLHTTTHVVEMRKVTPSAPPMVPAPNVPVVMVPSQDAQMLEAQMQMQNQVMAQQLAAMQMQQQMQQAAMAQQMMMMQPQQQMMPQQAQMAMMMPQYSQPMYVPSMTVATVPQVNFAGNVPPPPTL